MRPPEGGAAHDSARPGARAQLSEGAGGAAHRETGSGGPPDGTSTGEGAAAAGGAPGGAAGRPAGDEPPRGGGSAMSGLSLPSRIIVGLVLAAVAVGAAVHLGMVFLHVAPSNTLSQQNAKAVNAYIYPEFEQNWKLFAPNPLQQNSDVQARAQVREPDGSLETTGWVDLTAMDDARIVHNPFPSHANQNELRRAWTFYTDTHDDQERPNGQRGDLARRYVLRIVAHRFGPRLNGGAVEQVQVRSVTWAVPAPPWSSDKIDTRPGYRVLPWWPVDNGDFT